MDWGGVLPVALLAFLLAGPVRADRDGHCMAAPSGSGCVAGRITDGDGILRPGLHVYFGDPTDRYDHGVLGDRIEWGSLIWLQQGSAAHGPYMMLTHTLPADRVFEDFAPRLSDLDGDGQPEIIVVETEIAKGAQLAIYALRGDSLTKIAATPPIGRTRRWLAPIGTADLDGDGSVELAYIDRPHLAKILRIWRFERGRLIPMLELAGLTNHRIGDRYISGGIRDCGNGPEIVTANANWSRVVATVLTNGFAASRDLRPIGNGDGFDRALACKD